MTLNKVGWLPDDHVFALPADAVQIWRLFQRFFEDKSPSFLKDLSEDELARVDRFRFTEHRNRYVINRGVLRSLLGRYLGLEPREIKLQYDGNGKPSLNPYIHGQPAIQFNIAHSQDVSLFAFALNFAVGVDCEHIRPIPNAEAIVGRFFSAIEKDAFHSLPEAQKSQAFFKYWTLKEAFIKALGRGLSMPLDRFSVSVKPAEPPRLIEIDGGSAEAGQWLLQSWSPTPGYMAAAACRKHGVSFQHFKIPPDSPD